MGYILQSYLIPASKAKEQLETDTYDIKCSLMPGITIYYSENSKKEKYHRWGDDSNIEPLVIKRSYDELEVDDIEIVEEFRLLFNLYYDSKSKE